VRALGVVVSGLVQGVFFRDTCRREATRRGVAGWVRNNPDGTVEAVFEGSDDAVDAMVRWMADGPPGARVEEVTTYEVAPSGAASFRVTFG
jgi:acylphosphatase